MEDGGGFNKSESLFLSVLASKEAPSAVVTGVDVKK